MSRRSYAHVAARLFDTPHLIEQAKLNTIIAAVSGRLGIVAINGDAIDPALVDDATGDMLTNYAGLKPQRMPRTESELIERQNRAAMLAQMSDAEVEPQDEGHYLVGDVSVIPVMGTLVQRGSWMSSMSGLTGYDEIGDMLKASLNDARVSKILMEFDSPGGEAAGAFDLADQIYAASQQKPITAYANEYAASGAYLLASQANELVIPRSGKVGSIGVVTGHADRSEQLKQQGVAYTWVYAGDKKIDGNPTQPLSDRAKADMQEGVDKLYGLFTTTAARGRDLEPAAMAATEAGMYMGEDAVAAGLADRVGTFEDTLNRMLDDDDPEAELPDDQPPDDDAPAEEEAGAGDPDETQVHQPGASPRLTSPQEIPMPREIRKPAGNPATTAANPANERARIAAIMKSEEAKGREGMAEHLAYNTEMTAEAAIAMLKVAPKAEASAPATPAKTALELAMERQGSPGIKPANPEANEPSTFKPKVLEGATLHAGDVYRRRNAVARGGGDSEFGRAKARAQAYN